MNKKIMLGVIVILFLAFASISYAETSDSKNLFNKDAAGLEKEVIQKMFSLGETLSKKSDDINPMELGSWDNNKLKLKIAYIDKAIESLKPIITAPYAGMEPGNRPDQTIFEKTIKLTNQLITQKAELEKLDGKVDADGDTSWFFGGMYDNNDYALSQYNPEVKDDGSKTKWGKWIWPIIIALLLIFTIKGKTIRRKVRSKRNTKLRKKIAKQIVELNQRTLKLLHRLLAEFEIASNEMRTLTAPEIARYQSKMKKLFQTNPKRARDFIEIKKLIDALKGNSVNDTALTSLNNTLGLLEELERVIIEKNKLRAKQNEQLKKVIGEKTETKKNKSEEQVEENIFNTEKEKNTDSDNENTDSDNENTDSDE